MAGNDEIALTAVVPQAAPGVPRRHRRRAACWRRDPLLTEPSARRLTVRTPLARLAEVAAWLQRRGAVLEQLYDY